MTAKKEFSLSLKKFKEKLKSQGINSINLPKIEEPTYFGGSFSRDILGFAAPFLGFSKAASGLNLVTKIPKATTKTGAVTQFVAKNATIGAAKLKLITISFVKKILGFPPELNFVLTSDDIDSGLFSIKNLGIKEKIM